MNRPCFSLGVLLTSLAVCLLAVGSANSQTGLDLHSPPCLMCPYSGHPYADPIHAALAEQTDHPAAVAELPLATPAAAPASDAQVEVDDTDYDLDYDEYDFSNYDDSDYDDSGYDDAAYDDADYDDAAYDDAAYDDADYDGAAYDYSDYDYSEYENESDYEADYEADYDYTDSDLGTDPSNDDSAADDTDYTDSEYDYSNYDLADYERWYAEGGPAAPAPGVAAPTSDPAPAEASEFDEFDNYDYEDYFAEVYGTVEDDVEAEDVTADDAASAEIPAADAPVVAQEDVEPFDDFDVDAREPVATEDDPIVDPTDSDAAIYDLRTSYDDTYDEVMAPAIEAPAIKVSAIEAPAAEDQDFSGTDHCFGGYVDAYRSEYRCDLADAYRDDAYQSFYHDGPDPSATQIAPESVVEPASEASADEAAFDSDAAAKSALSLAVEPYVALVMDRVGTAWQRLSLDAIVAKAVDEVAKLPEFISQGAAEAPVAASMADYIDCHVDAADCESHCCEIDCFAPWEPAQPVGSGVEQLHDAASKPTDPQAEIIDTTELDLTKALIRDLRTRMNAARQSPPLR